MRLTPAEAAQLGIVVPPIGHKYKAQPQIIDGIRFASKAEGLHYGRLKLRERAGDIRNLESTRSTSSTEPAKLPIGSWLPQ